MIGIPVVLGLDFSPSTVMAQVPGKALRMSVRDFVQTMEPSGPLDRLLRRYIAFSLRYAHQTVVCNAQHSVEERMCRWLLMTHDRVEQEEFLLTHEFLAEMLAVRRQSVTVLQGTGNMLRETVLAQGSPAKVRASGVPQLKARVSELRSFPPLAAEVADGR